MPVTNIKLRWPGKVPYVAWSTLKRKSVYGWTEASVRRQLVPVLLLGKRIYVHRKIAADVTAIENAVRRYESAHGRPHWNATRIDVFNWRPIRGGTSLSRHAHAIALDINPVQNPMGATKTTLPSYVVQIIVDHGFDWGGRWQSPVDPMHFQRH